MAESRKLKNPVLDSAILAMIHITSMRVTYSAHLIQPTSVIFLHQLNLLRVVQDLHNVTNLQLGNLECTKLNIHTNF